MTLERVALLPVVSAWACIIEMLRALLLDLVSARRVGVNRTCMDIYDGDAVRVCASSDHQSLALEKGRSCSVPDLSTLRFPLAVTVLPVGSEGDEKKTKERKNTSAQEHINYQPFAMRSGEVRERIG